MPNRIRAKFEGVMAVKYGQGSNGQDWSGFVPKRLKGILTLEARKGRQENYLEVETE